MSKETIEEAAERFSELQEATYTSQHKITYKHGFVDGAKCQQENMYDIMDAYTDDVMGGCTLRAKEWFETFNK